jgi:hypothetical protein
MVVIARIPRLDPIARAADGTEAPGVTPRRRVSADTFALEEALRRDVTRRPPAARRRDGPRFPIASTMVLALIAVALWGAVWRKERLEALERRATVAPADGMATRPAPSGQTDGSVTR